MKILHISKYYYPFLGGLENYVKNLCEEHVKSESANVTVFAANTVNEFKEELINGVKIIKFPLIIKLISAPIFPLVLSQINKYKFDLIHLHMPNPCAEIACLLDQSNTKVVVTWHGDITRRSQRLIIPFYRRLVDKVLSKSSAVIVTSPQFGESSEFLVNYKKKVRVIPLGVDLDVFSDKNQSCINAEDQAARFGDYILFVGRLSHFKGINILIDAFKIIKNKEIKLIIIGDGELKEYVKNESFFDQRIVYLGNIDHCRLPSYYRGCKFLVFPSTKRTESFGFVQLEAMGFGIPVIGTKLGTGVEFVNQDGQTGILLEPGNRVALADAIDYLLANDDKRIEMGQRALTRVVARFDQKVVAKEVFSLYKEVVGRN